MFVYNDNENDHERERQGGVCDGIVSFFRQLLDKQRKKMTENCLCDAGFKRALRD